MIGEVMSRIGISRPAYERASRERMPRARVAVRLGRVVVAGLLLVSMLGETAGEPPMEDWPLRFAVPALKETVVVPGETFTVEVPVSSQSAEPIETELALTLLDFWGAPRAHQTQNLQLKPKEKKVLQVAFEAPEKGLFKIGVEFRFKEKNYLQDVSSFAAWPRPVKGASDQPTFFRDVITCWEGHGGPLQQAARLGQSWVMGHDMLQATWWSRVQPKPGPFDWEKFGYQIDNAKKNGFNIVGEFIFAPPWASKDPKTAKQETRSGYPLPTVPRVELWRKYVYETVNHYKDTIKHWQVGNEPHVCLFWSGSIEEFATLCQSACEEARRADPTCKVLGSGLGLEQYPWNERFAKAGGFSKFDAVSIHGYVSRGFPERIEEDLRSGLELLKGLLLKYPPHRELPIWNTEGGDYSTTFLRGAFPAKELSFRVPAYKLVKYYAIEMSLGIVCHFYYLQNGGNAFGSLVDLDINNAPKPLLMARIAMEEQLKGRTYRHTFKAGDKGGRVWALLFEAPDQQNCVALCWAGEGGEVRIKGKWGRDLEATCDLMGNVMGTTRSSRRKLTLTEEPQYLRLSCSADEALRTFEKAALKVVKEPVPLPEPVKLELKPQLPPTTADYAPPLENPEGNFKVDLRPYCNMGFTDETAGDGKGGWRDEGPLNDMRCVEPGPKTYYGVPFELIDPATNNGKSIITMKGMTLPQFPSRVEIDLKSVKCRALYFLHSSTAPKGLAHYEIKYADGQTMELPIAAGVNANNWWFGYRDGEVSKPVPFLTKNTADGKPAYRYLRVWEWENPRPREPVASLAIVVKEVKQVYQALSLVALSGVKW